MQRLSVVALLGDWSAGPGHLYERLAAQIAALVDSGQLPAGTPLPAERALAARLAVARGTVVTAYEILRAAERVETRRGSGTWVRGRPRGAAVPEAEGVSLRTATLRRTGEAIDLSTATLPATPAVQEAGAAFLASDACAALLRHNGYDPAGLAELRETIGRGVSWPAPVSPQSVLITTGDQQALSLLAEVLLMPGDQVLVEAPTNPGMLDVLRSRGVALRWIPPVATAEGISEFERAMATRMVRAAYLMPTLGPHGLIADPITRRRIARAAAAASTIVIDDRSRACLAFADDTKPLAAYSPAPVVTVDSMSKRHWGGLRVGWLVAEPDIVAKLVRVKTRVDLGSSLISQAIAGELLRHHDGALAERRSWLEDRAGETASLLRELSPDWAFPPVRGGLSIWLGLPEGYSPAAFTEVAARFGVTVTSGEVYAPDGPPARHINMVYARPPGELREGVQRLARAWDWYKNHTGHDPAAGAARELLPFAGRRGQGSGAVETCVAATL